MTCSRMCVRAEVRAPACFERNVDIYRRRSVPTSDTIVRINKAETISLERCWARAERRERITSVAGSKAKTKNVILVFRFR